MIANHGYKDAEGEFYITIDTAKCAECQAKPCSPACPRAMFVEEETPYGDDVIAIHDAKRKQVKYECMGCKPSHGRPPLPCVVACPCDALTHSW